MGLRKGRAVTSAAAWLAAGPVRAGAAVALSLALAACGRSQEAKVLAALKAKFPDGQRQCYGLSQDEVGIHVSLPFGGTLFYPSTGPTAPTRHLFVLYAAPAADPVPELVGMLTEQGVLLKQQVQASIDVETAGQGPQVIKGGLFTHQNWQHHALTTFPVDIYVTAGRDTRFLYDVHTSLQNVAYSPGTFPSRTFPNPLPPDGTHYVIPTVTPYALSVVTSVCAAETPTVVEDVKTVHNWIGQAAVTFSEDIAPWMATPAFSRAASAPRQATIGAPRRATILFSEGDDGKLAYREER